MFNRLLTVDAAWNWLALEIVLKSTLLLLLAGSIVMLLCRSSAAVRHRVWSLLFVGLLLLPLVQLALPGLSWQIIPDRWHLGDAEITAATTHADSRTSRPNVPSAAEYASRASEPVAAKTDSPPAMRHADLISMDLAQPQAAAAEGAGTALPAVHQVPDENVVGASAVWLPLIWLLGAGVALIPLITGLFGNLRLRHHSRPLADSEWQRLVAALSHRLGLRRRVTLLFGGPQQMPMTFGLLRPCVVLPSSAEHWSAQRRRIVLLHELAHVKRCDVPLQLIARLAAAVYWFHPLVWWALRRMRLEREHACDDCVLQAGQEAPDYATQLLEIAHTHRSPTPLLTAALSMARRSQLEGRLLAVLDTHRRRNHVGRAAAFQLIVVALGLVACIGLVRPALQADSPESTNDDGSSVATQDSAKPATQTVITGTVLSPQGKPVPSASVEVIAFDSDNWRRTLPNEDQIDHYQARADAAGRFRLVLPRDISRPRRSMNIIASAAGYALNKKTLEPTRSHHLEIKLYEPKAVRLQLIDTAGNPVANVQPHVKSVALDEDSMWLGHRNGHLEVSGWPRFSRSDEQGYVSVAVPASTKTLVLLIDDQRVGGHMLPADVGDEPTSVVLNPARFLHGKVTAADSGKPIAGAEVVVIEEPYRQVRTDADGSFRIAAGTTVSTLYREGESIIHIYPPPESPYLFHALEWQWPNDGIGDAELSVALERGILVEGQILEKGSGTPVAGATVYFDPQEEDNPFFRKNAQSRLLGSDMKYATDAQGRFSIPVWPGPGYLLVRGPTLDFVHVQISYGDRHYGKPGLSREYYDAAVRLNLEPDKPPQPLKIELDRGVTLRRKVVRPDGQPAAGKAYARSYLQEKEDINSWLPDITVENGLLELPGYEPQRSNPLFVVDLEHGCAAVVSPPASEIDLTSPPIQLQPCGAAKFRFVNDKGKALAGYRPGLLMIVTPGAAATHYIRPNQPLWADCVMWQNIARGTKFPVTDRSGQVTVENLIPGAKYRVYYYTDESGLQDGYEFTVHSGETVDVGEVVIPARD
ncbi:MAG: M56 family metallopeptidase [Pirellulales bacterium]